MSAVSLTSTFFNRIGHLLIGPPMSMMRHVYLIPGDRVRQEPIQPDDLEWLHKQAMVGHISRESQHRLGPLVFIGVCAGILAGLLALASIHGVKVGLHKAENALSSHTTSTDGTAQPSALKKSCDFDREHGNPLSPACANVE